MNSSHHLAELDYKRTKTDLIHLLICNFIFFASVPHAYTYISHGPLPTIELLAAGSQFTGGEVLG